MRPGLSTEKLLEEGLILVAGWPDPTLDMAGRHVFVDWGPEFVRAHALHLPDLTDPGLTLPLGALAAGFIRSRRMAAYLPARYVKRHFDAGEPHLGSGAPTFPYPVWAVWREDLDPGLRAAAATALQEVVATVHVDQGAVMGELVAISEEAVTGIDIWRGSGFAIWRR